MPSEMAQSRLAVVRSRAPHYQHERPRLLRYRRCNRFRAVQLALLLLAPTVLAVIALPPARATAAGTPVTISSVAGTFYPNPANSGPFDSTQLSAPQWSQPFPLINFNPSSTTGYCSNNTGVNAGSRPMTDVFANPDQACGTIVAQGNGLQAGVSTLSNFEAVFLASLNASSAGQVTFNIPADDGWILGLGPELGGTAQPTYVSGSLFNTPSVTPSQGYQVVGGYNSTASPGPEQVTVNCPASGSYPLEMDYTECCGDGLYVTLGTTTAGVVPPLNTQQPLVGGPVTLPETLGQQNFCWRCYLQAQAGDPVNTATGNFTESATDITIPGRGIPLGFTRAYNAAAASTNGPLGYGWASDAFMSLSQPGGTGPVTITQEGGSQVVFSQNGTTYVPAAPRDIATLTRNSDGTWTFTRVAQQTYTFSSAGQLIGEKDLNGYTTSFAYNTSSQLTTITDPAGRSLAIGWTGATITSVTDANVTPNRTVSFQYNDSNGNLTDVIDVNGGHTHFVYDANHRMTNMYDPNCLAAGTACNAGNGVVIHYNSAGKVDWQEDQLGRMTTFAYSGDPTSATGGTTLITDPKSNVTADTYQYGVLTSETKGYGTTQAATTQYTYDAVTATPISKTDPDGRTTFFTVDGSGNQLSTTDPLGRQTLATYNSLNEALTRTDGNDVTTTYSYDTSGNLKMASTPLVGTTHSKVVAYTYGDPNHPGDVTKMTDPDGFAWQYAYDAYGDRTSETDPLNHVTTTCYNADGWKIASYSAKAGTLACSVPPPASAYETSYSYVQPNNQIDEFGDVQAITDPLGHTTSTSYDLDRNVTGTVDGNNNPTTYLYDLANEQTDAIRADHSDVHTDYNPDGTILDEKDAAGHTTQAYLYDALARVTSSSDGLGNATTYTYDFAGNRLTQQDPGGNCGGSPPTGCTTTAYDADNEVIATTYSDGVTPNVTAITYDADGQRTGMTDGTGTSSWVWDSLHRLTSFTDGHRDQVQYQYNLRGLVTQIVYPSGDGVSRGYDNAGRWTSVQDWLGGTTTFGYDVNNNVTTTTLPSGSAVVGTSGYNAADQLTSMSDVKGPSTTLFATTYGRDNNGQVTTDSSVPASVGSDQYTTLNQLCYAGSTNGTACSSPPAGSQAYAFDTGDNLISDNGTTQTFNAADELCWSVSGTSANTCATAPTGATTYTYNTRGDRTNVAPASGSASTLGYDQANRLTSFTQGSTTATYSYNGDGMRMSKTTSGATSNFAWDVSDGTPELLSDGSFQYVYGPTSAAIEQIALPPAISLVGSANQGAKTKTITLNLPASVKPGDEVLVGSLQPNGTAVSAPSGYGSVTSATATSSYLQVFSHVVQQGDSAVTLSYSSSTTWKSTLLVVYRGSDPNQPVDVSASASAENGTIVVAPSVTPAFNEDKLVVFQGGYGSAIGSQWSPPSGMQEEAGGAATNESTGVADQQLISGPTGTRSSVSTQTQPDLTTISIAISQARSALLLGTANASGKSTSLTLTLPAGTQANDQVVLASTQPSTTSVTAPSAYSQVTTVSSGGQSAGTTTVFRHTVVSGDTSVTLSYSASTAQAVALAVYRGIDPAIPIDVSAVGSAAAATSVTAPSMTPAYTGDQLVLFQGAVGTFRSGTWSAPTGTTEETETSAGNTVTGLADKPLGAAAPTGSQVSTFSTSANLTTVGVAILLTPTDLYFGSDQLSSTRVLIDPAGVVRASFTYDPYGNLTNTTGTFTTSLRFAGQYRDAETGLIYLRARYYDPATAQFLSRDPFVATTRQPYSYVRGNPLNSTDPLGLGYCGTPNVSQACSAAPNGVAAHTCIVIGNGSTDEVDLPSSVPCSAIDPAPGAPGPSYSAFDPNEEGAVPAGETCSFDAGTGFSHCTTPPSQLSDTIFGHCLLALGTVLIEFGPFDVPAWLAAAYEAGEVGLTGFDIYERVHDRGQ